MEFGNLIYSYYNGFVINVANVLHLSYYEINFILFGLLYPVLILGSFGFYLFQRGRLKKIEKQNNSTKTSCIAASDFQP